MSEEPDVDAAAVIAAGRAQIRGQRYTIVGTAGWSGPACPPYSHTIGLSALRRCGYEVVVNGSPSTAMFNALTVIARRALAGELQPVDGLLIEGVFERGYLIRMRPVHPSHRFPWITRVLDAPSQPPLWQAQFPADDRRWPGDPGYDPAPYRQTDLTRPCPGDQAPESAATAP